MADKPESNGQEPNLELPSLLGFGRKKRRSAEVTQQIPVPPPPLPPPDEPGEVETRSAEPAASAGESDEPDAAGTDVRVDEPFRWPVEEPLGDSDAERPASGTSVQRPVLNPRIAAIMSGALVGLVGVVLSYFASRGCESVRGVGSCGGIGLLALLVILAIQVVLGALLLKALRLSDPTSTSLLGVGLMAVLVLLFLLSSLDSILMLLVIPVVSALTFLLSWWVTVTFVEGPDSAQHR